MQKLTCIGLHPGDRFVLSTLHYSDSCYNLYYVFVVDIIHARISRYCDNMQALTVSEASRRELRQMSTSQVPREILENMVVLSGKDGEAALSIMQNSTRRAYQSATGPEETFTPTSPDRRSAPTDCPTMVEAEAEDLAEAIPSVDEESAFEMSLCHEEPVVSEKDRLQFAAIQQLQRLEGERHDPNADEGLVEEAERLMDGQPGDEIAREQAQRLVATYDNQSPLRSIDPEWFMLLFPDLFPNGTGGPPHKVSQERWLRHLVLRDGSPFQRAAFVCAADDRQRRHDVNLATYLQFRTSPARFKTAASSTTKDVKAVAELLAKRRRPEPNDTDEVKALFSQVLRYRCVYAPSQSYTFRSKRPNLPGLLPPSHTFSRALARRCGLEFCTCNPSVAPSLL